MVIKLAVLLGFKVKNAKKHVKYVHTVLAKKYFFFSLFNFWDRVGASFKSWLRLHSKNAGSDRLRTRLTTIATLYVTDDAIALLCYFSNIELCNGVIS